jgi:trehalose utilization protein
VVWDERQPSQKQAYDSLLGNYIADHLGKQPGISVHSFGLDDSEQGLSQKILSECDVLIWWGHQRQGEVSQQTGKKIVERIKQGTTSLITLHSAHWATPFMEAMNEITKLHTKQKYGNTNKQQVEISYIVPPKPYTLPQYESRITPYTTERKFPDGKQRVEVHLIVAFLLTGQMANQVQFMS